MKTYQKEISKRAPFFVFQKRIKISMLQLHQISIHQNRIKNAKQGTMKLRRFFNYRNYIEESTSKRRHFFGYQNYLEKSMSKQRRFSIHQNYIKESMPK